MSYIILVLVEYTHTYSYENASLENMKMLKKDEQREAIKVHLPFLHHMWFAYTDAEGVRPVRRACKASNPISDFLKIQQKRQIMPNQLFGNVNPILLSFRAFMNSFIWYDTLQSKRNIWKCLEL